jgi:hypothetical protein
MSVCLPVHVRHCRNQHERQQDDAARKRPAAVRVRRDVAFGVLDHQFLIERVVKQSVNILTSSAAISYGAAIGTTASGFGKKGSIPTTFQGDRLSEVVSGT